MPNRPFCFVCHPSVSAAGVAAAQSAEAAVVARAHQGEFGATNLTARLALLRWR